MRLLMLVCIFALVACSPSSSEEFVCEGESLMKSLTKELRAIQTKEDLMARRYRLKRRFDKICELMIEAQSQKKSLIDSEDKIESEISDALFVEVSRIYQMEGGREIMEELQSEALARLDAFHRSLRK